MTRAATMKTRTTAITVNGETWHVPRGFGVEYRRTLKDHFALIAAGQPGVLISEVIDLLALVGYEVTVDQVAGWDLRKRVEAVIYARTEHARASDNPIPRHPRLTWLPDPWQGPPAETGHIRADLRGAFSGPSGTPIVEDTHVAPFNKQATLDAVKAFDVGQLSALALAGHLPSAIDRIEVLEDSCRGCLRMIDCLEQPNMTLQAIAAVLRSALTVESESR